MNRIYVCHTYYHVYISILKELNYQKADNTKGTMALSLMSTDFKDLKSRLEKSNIFKEVFELNEIHPYSFEEKFKYEQGKGNWVFKAYTRMLAWRHTAKQEEKFINVDFSYYDDIFVYCDGDPIGQYLNYKQIYYHAVEDGLDSCKWRGAEKANASFFFLKLVLAKLGIIFIHDGYSKYAIDLEVNNKQGISSFGRKVLEVPREVLLSALNSKERQAIYDVFFIGIPDTKNNNDKKNIMLLTQPLCTLEKRIEMYKNIIHEHCQEYNVYIKPHPIDNADYETEFPECIVLERFFPIEILNFKCDLDIEKIITVYSNSLQQLTFANEKAVIGVEILDRYEDPILHAMLVK